MSETPPTLTGRRLLTALTWIVGLAVIVALVVFLDLSGEDGDKHAAPDSAATAVSTEAAPDTQRAPAPRPAAPSQSAPSPTARDSADSSQVPQHVLATLELIDAGDWPAAANASGTRGGDTFRNVERILPATSSSGRSLTYREWDVNPKERGRSRDAERIVTGSDGSAWYTADHYRTFIRIRGPSS